MQLTLFIVIIIGMMLLALVLILPAFFNAKNESADNAKQGNINVARERLQYLQQRIASGEIDAATADESKREIESQLFSDTEHQHIVWQQGRRSIVSTVLALLLVVVVAPLLYSLLGTPSMLGTTENIEELSNRLQLHIAKSPADIAAIIWLARVLAAQNKITEASAYYTKYRHLAGDTPDIIAEQINILLQHQNNTAQVSELLELGLNKAAQHPMLLWLAGIHAEKQNNIPQALAYWQHAYDNLSDNPKQQQLIATKINQTKTQQHNLAAPTSALPMQDGKENINSDTGIAVTVSLGTGIMVATDTVLFIFAKAAATNIKRPLAVYKGLAKDLPLTVRLNDSTAMTETLKMSYFTHYNVTARLSPSGSVSANSGDWFATAAAQAGDSIKMIIDQQRP